MYCVPEVHMTKFKNPDMKIENESKKFLKEDPTVNVMLEVGRERLPVRNKEESPDSRKHPAAWLEKDVI